MGLGFLNIFRWIIAVSVMVADHPPTACVFVDV